MSYRIKGKVAAQWPRGMPRVTRLTMQTYLGSIHILFFATWLGGNLFCLAIFLPASASLPPDAQWQARTRASKGLNTISAVSAPLVLLSGFARVLLPEVNDGRDWASRHSLVLGIKVVLTLWMIVNHMLQAFRYAPAPAPNRADPCAAFDHAWRMWVRLLTINVILGFACFFLGLSLV